MDKGFMEYMGYRNSLIEDKIDECLEKLKEGKTEITVDRGDLTDEEVRTVKREVERRYGSGR